MKSWIPFTKLSPVQYFGWGLFVLWATMTSLIWGIAQYRISQDEQTELAQAADSIGNMALAIEQSVSRTSSEIDRVLKYIRTIRTASKDTLSWQDISASEFASNKLVAQIAIMNKDGMMLTSTAMPYPKTLVDLSDREHYLVHRRSGLDELFISKPVIGRASGKTTIQYSRPYFDSDYQFAGVVVISLDPEKLTATYDGLQLGEAGGIAVVGNDNIIRAGSGVFAKELGQDITALLTNGDVVKQHPGARILTGKHKNGTDLLLGRRRVPDYPFTVIAASLDTRIDIGAIDRQRTVYAIAIGVTAIVSLCAAIAMMMWRKHLNIAMEREALTLEKRVADASSKAREEFLAVMTHEIRTPLNGVLGALDLLQSEDLTDRSKRQLAIATESGETLLALIDDILVFSKFRHGKFELNLMPVNLDGFAKSIYSAMDPLSRRSGNTLKLNVSLLSERMVLVDAHRLRQVISNLIGNAFKFTRSGTIELSVLETRTKNSKRVIQFAVSDTGIGIPEDKQKIIFDAFQSLDAKYTRRNDGTGLGLAISDKIVRSMGSEIKVTSAIGKGSRFYFDLECDTAAEVELQTGAASKSDGSIPRNILLVEDNATNRYIAAEILGEAGHHVTPVENGALAVEAAKRNKFDLILMDISMPVMDGFRATSIIRSSEGPNRETQIVALTAHVTEGVENEYKKAGMNSWMTKPIRKEKLLNFVGGSDHGSVVPAQQSRAPLVDPQYLGDFARGGDGSKVAKLIAIFLRDLEAKTAAIEVAVEAHDLKTVGQIAHSLAGSAGAVGATLLATEARKLQKTPDLNGLAKLRELMAETQHEFERLSKERPGAQGSGVIAA